MKTLYYQSPTGNFGDDLNVSLWPQLIPDFHSLLPDSVFVGIGTILDERIPQEKHVVVMGTGHRPNEETFSLSPQWSIYGVRGHLTTDAVGLPKKMAIGDPAHLIAKVARYNAFGESSVVGLVPHYSSLEADEQGWKRCAELCDLKLISPCNEVDAVVNEIAKCDRVLTESLHGAIVADTLRIPWLSLRSTTKHLEGMKVNSFKWQDWCSTLSLQHDPIDLPLLWRASGLAGSLRRSIKVRWLCRELKRARNSDRFQLSKTEALEERIQVLMDAVGRFTSEARASTANI